MMRLLHDRAIAQGGQGRTSCRREADNRLASWATTCFSVLVPRTNAGLHSPNHRDGGVIRHGQPFGLLPRPSRTQEAKYRVALLHAARPPVLRPGHGLQPYVAGEEVQAELLSSCCPSFGGDSMANCSSKSHYNVAETRRRQTSLKR